MEWDLSVSRMLRIRCMHYFFILVYNTGEKGLSHFANCSLVIALCLSGAMSFVKYSILELKLFRKTSTESDVSFEVVDIAYLKKAVVWSLNFLFFCITIVRV